MIGDDVMAYLTAPVFTLTCEGPNEDRRHDEETVDRLRWARALAGGVYEKVGVGGDGWWSELGRMELVTDANRHLSRETPMGALEPLRGALRLMYRVDCPTCGDNIRATDATLNAALDALSGHGVSSATIPVLRRTLNLVK